MRTSSPGRASTSNCNWQRRSNFLKLTYMGKIIRLLYHRSDEPEKARAAGLTDFSSSGTRLMQQPVMAREEEKSLAAASLSKGQAPGEPTLPATRCYFLTAFECHSSFRLRGGQGLSRPSLGLCSTH